MIKQAEWKLEQAEDYLKQYKDLYAYKANLIDEARQILVEVALPGSMDYSADRVQSSYDDQMLSKHLKIEARTAEVERKIGEVSQRMDAIKYEINSMDDALYKRMLYMRYIDFCEWQEITQWINEHFRPTGSKLYLENNVRGKMKRYALKSFIRTKRGMRK